MRIEPFSTAFLVAMLGSLLVASAVLSRLSRRTGVPVVLIFLGLGMLAGSEGPGGWFFEDYQLSFRLGTLALALILFDGGLNTRYAAVRRVATPAGLLATLGVAVTAGLTALGAHLLGFGSAEALLLGAVVASTDAAAVFSVVRSSGMRLRPRVGSTLEVESGFNDPVAVALTFVLTGHALGEGLPPAMLAGQVVLQLVVGGLGGLAIGRVGRALLGRVELTVGGLYPILSVAIGMLAFGLPTLVGGSGFLAVYVAGLVLGNGALPFRDSLLRIHDFVAWAGQILMFLMLGLLVFPSRLLEVAPVGIAVALWIMLVARPVAVLGCLGPLGYTRRELAFVAWVGLRGAVPIILAAYPLLRGYEGGGRIFDVVFFVVVVSVLLQGTTVPWLTRVLRLGTTLPPAPPAQLEISSRRSLEGEVRGYLVGPESAVAGVRATELPLPAGAGVGLIVRGRQLLAGTPELVLEPGDWVYVVGHRVDRPELQLLFGRREEEASMREPAL
jgi:cell volume regulation protein A